MSKVAELGFEGAAKYKDSRYEGLLQTDLAVMLKDNSDCRRQVWNDLKDKLVSQVGSASGAEPVTSEPVTEVQEAENFKFRLQGCVLSKGDVACNFTVTNIGQDALLTLRDDTSVFDDLGGKYELDQACIGNKCQSLASLTRFISREMISDVPVQIRLVFSGLQQEARKIPRLKVVAERGSAGKRFSMGFQNIALSLQ